MGLFKRLVTIQAAGMSALMLLSGCAAITDSVGPAGQRDGAKPTVMSGRDSNGNPVPSGNTSVDLVNLLRAELQTQNWKVVEGAETAIDNSHRTVGIAGNQQGLSRLITAIEAIPDENFKVRARNHTVGEVVFASNAACSEFIRTVRSEQVGSRIITDALAGGFATWASLAKPLSTTRLLGGASAFSTATGASIDRNAFSQTAAELITDQIVKLRMNDRAVLEADMKKEYVDWPLSLALADVVNYHRDCSLNRGLSQMKEVLIARESTVNAIRIAATQVYQAGGDNRQIVAVLSGLGNESSSATFVGGANEFSGSWMGDLNAQSAAVADCLKTFADYAKGLTAATLPSVSTVNLFDASGACVGPKGNGVASLNGKAGWIFVYPDILEAALHAASWPTCPAAKKDQTPAQAWSACVDINTAPILATYQKLASNRAQTQATLRSVVASRLGNWMDAESGATLSADLVALGNFTVPAGTTPTLSNVTLTDGDPTLIAATRAVLASLGDPKMKPSQAALMGRAAEREQYAIEIKNKSAPPIQ